MLGLQIRERAVQNQLDAWQLIYVIWVWTLTLIYGFQELCLEVCVCKVAIAGACYGGS